MRACGSSCAAATSQPWRRSTPTRVPPVQAGDRRMSARNACRWGGGKGICDGRQYAFLCLPRSRCWVLQSGCQGTARCHALLLLVFSFSCGSSESQHAATLPPRLQALRRGAWEEGSPAGWRPRDREGHAACPWGARSMLLHGGFGGGIAFDLHLLIPDGAAAGGGDGSAGAGSSNAAASGAAGGSGGAAGGGTSHRWVQPRVAGTSPVPR